MKILHRYVLKEHVGPLTFALTALTSILLLQYIGKHFGELVGKGLPTTVIAEFFGLSVPLTIALTLPMAVLVATLYAFSRLAAENEITALKASGVSLVSVLQPVLWAALGVTVVMIGFNDQVLPRANHRLAVLQRDIAQKKPTFGLREQVINEVSPGKFYLRAGHLDEASNMMREVTIYDMADPTRRRTIFADSGNMAMSKGMTDLNLTLYNGNMQDVPTANPDELQRLYFNVDQIRVRGVGNQFQKTTSDAYKSDREMTVCEMQAAQDRARREHEAARKDFERKLAELRKAKASLSKEVLNANTAAPWDVGLGRLYCNGLAWLAPKQAKAQGVSTTPRAVGRQSASSTSQSTSSTAASRPPPASRVGAAPVLKPNQGVVQGPPANSSDLVAMEGLRIRLQDSAQLMNSYGVEIHKKFALAVACFVFVLLGAPIALRFPRGGVGLTIGVSLFVFALYYVCLIAGESIAKRGLMPAVVSMWMANVIFSLAALWLLSKMGKEGSTARGGDMKDMFGAIKGSIRSKLGWKNRRVERESGRLTRMVRALDRYVFVEFWKIFVTTALGFPVLIIIIDLTDNLDKYLGQHLSVGRIALSYLYWIPDSMFMVLPAAVLFATVFAIGGLTRHSEITAAKASGISFYRFIAPIFVGATIATFVGLILGELAPITNKKRLEILDVNRVNVGNDRYNFAYAADGGRVYKIGALHVLTPSIEGMVIERKGNGPAYPSYVVTASMAQYKPGRGWVLQKGAMHVIPDTLHNMTFSFDSLIDRHFTELPKQLTLAQKAPADMGFRELGRFITSMERSGAEVNELRVERMLKIAIPVTCIVILLFGAPLATSTQRGGAAYGIGLSLATTVIFLMLIQLTKGIGGKGMIPADLAAWLPSIIFGVVGAILFARVRT